MSELNADGVVHQLDVMCPRCKTRRMGYATSERSQAEPVLGGSLEVRSDELLVASCKLCLRRGDACRWEVPRRAVAEELGALKAANEALVQRRAHELGGALEPI